MAGRYLGHDADGLTESFHFDNGSGDFAIEVAQDVAPILDHNKRLQNGGDGYSPSRELRHIAKIPCVVIELWRTQYGVDLFNKNHAPAVRRLLNSNEWRYLRTSPGRY